MKGEWEGGKGDLTRREAESGNFSRGYEGIDWSARAVRAAATALYLAGAWRCDNLPPEIQAQMWEELRDALGLPVGTATTAGVGT